MVNSNELDINIPFLKSKMELDECNSENILLIFTASWCGPCQKISPKLVELFLNKNYEHIKFYKVDVDECEELCDEYDIKCMPSFIFLKGKKSVYTHTGNNVNLLESKILNIFCNIEKSDEIDLVVDST